MKIVVILSILLTISVNSYCMLESNATADKTAQELCEIYTPSNFEESLTNHFLSLGSIETAQLILRPLMIEDAESLAPILYKNFMNRNSTTNIERSANWIKTQLFHNTSPWAIVLKETGELIGFFGLSLLIHETHMMIVRIHPNYNNKQVDFFQELLEMLLKISFVDLKLNRITLKTSDDSAWFGCWEKLGFIRKHQDSYGMSISKSYCWYVSIFSLLAEDYFKKETQEIPDHTSMLPDNSSKNNLVNIFKNLFK